MTPPRYLLGPFNQLLTMEGLPLCGPIHDEALPLIEDAGIIICGERIEAVGLFSSLQDSTLPIFEVPYPSIAVPGFIDSHTHICHGGSRYLDYALRLSGVSYQEIAAQGGGILSTVKHTRKASKEMLSAGIAMRCQFLKTLGVTTAEVKSGYGLSVDDEIKMLEAIHETSTPLHLIPTCLAAHTRPEEFSSNKEYLDHLIQVLLPVLKEKKLTNRIDIFVEEHAFSVEEARYYLQAAQQLGFTLTLHADQFSRGGAALAAEVCAISADHLEASSIDDLRILAENNVAATLLPGATLGLGQPFPRAREALDIGLSVVIASDWNPGSAPQGNLLVQSALLGASQHLTVAETLAAITYRAAHVLECNNKGILSTGYAADLAIFPAKDFREIIYYQGSMTPSIVVCQGMPTKLSSVQEPL